MLHAPLPAADRTVKVQPVTDLFNRWGTQEAWSYGPVATDVRNQPSVRALDQCMPLPFPP